jgi:hypothetical protein
MDLKGYKITLGEILSYPEAASVLKKAFPEFDNPMLLSLAKNITIEQILKMAEGKVPREVLDKTISELESI